MRSRLFIFLVILTGYLAFSSAFAGGGAGAGGLALDSAALVKYDPNVMQVAPKGDSKIDKVMPLERLDVVDSKLTTPSAAPPPGKPAPNSAAKSTPIGLGSTSEGGEAALVDYEADRMYDRGDGITRLVSAVRFHHNGAIIECDSAFQYDKNRMDFFGKVIIYQDSTYIYGDRVNYDGRTAVADVFAPIVKTMRGDMTLYSYNLSFNTKSKIGTYHGGGVLRSKDKLMESYRGEYNADLNIVKFMDSVAMSSDTYIIRTDSVDYNLDSETATFLAKSYIWDHERDFMLANRGNYFAGSETYFFTDSAYIMTPDNEMWADSVRYITPVRQAFMNSNVQILDTANNTLAFGDWGFYDDSLGRAVLTQRPSVRSWDKGDTSYMRADTIRMLSFEPGMSKAIGADFEGLESADELTSNATAFTDSLMAIPDSLRSVRDTVFRERDSLFSKSDSLSIKSDSLFGKSDTLPPLPISDTMLSARDSLFSKSDTLSAADTLFRTIDSLSIKSDSLFIKSDSMLFQSDSLQGADSLKANKPERERVMRAYHNVRIWSLDYQSVCDSTVSFSVDSTAVMYGKPILWSENNQITSSRIDIYTKDEQMDWAEFIDDPFITQQVLPRDTTQFNQASGKNMKVYFKDNEIDYAWMSGNVMNIYYMDEVQQGGYKEIVAMAAITCADLTIFFKERAPSRMIWGGAGEGPIYPIEKIPSEQALFLEGFTWQDSIRPKSAYEICQRAVVASFRPTASQFHQPSFSINSSMEMSKEHFTTAGTWRDRREPISVTPDYFEQRNRDLLF